MGDSALSAYVNISDFRIWHKSGFEKSRHGPTTTEKSKSGIANFAAIRSLTTIFSPIYRSLLAYDIGRLSSTPSSTSNTKDTEEQLQPIWLRE